MLKWTGYAVILAGAGVLEVLGDASIRQWFTGSSRWWAALGAALLVAYGLFVMLPARAGVARFMGFGRPRQFGELLGVYVAVFFLVSQVVGCRFLGESGPVGPLQWIGATLIVLGGLLFQMGA